MGYTVPGSDEIYKYLYRLDKHDRSLNDGFSWSILFVNDDSPECRAFLGKYGMELCYRTANRIRFVFFSHLSYYEHGEVLRKPNFLSRILHRVSNEKFDWETPGWENLRPVDFYPLDNSEKIGSLIESNVNFRSAIPGNKESWRFAQQLGIGRFVPCFVFIRELDHSSIHLLPVAGMSADQMYRHLRGFIDKFYEINRKALQNWSHFESTILNTCRELEMPLNSINDINRELNNLWKQLLESANTIEILKTGIDPAFLLELTERYFWTSQELVKDIKHLLSIYDTNLKLKNIDIWIATKPTVDNIKDIERYFENFPLKDDGNLPVEIKQLLSSANFALTTPIENDQIQSELFHWWRKARKGLTRKQYKGCRLQWIDYTQNKYGKECSGNLNPNIDYEFSFIRDLILKQKIGDAPQISSENVMARLALFFEADSKSVRWNELSKPFFLILHSYFSMLFREIPTWISTLDRTNDEKELTFGAFIARQNSRGCYLIDELLSNSPILHNYKGEVDSRRRFSSINSSAHGLDVGRRLLDELTINVEKWRDFSKLAQDIDRSYDSILTQIAEKHKEIEMKLFGSSTKLLSKKFPGKRFGRDKINDLLGEIDNYARIVASVKFPYENDKDVIYFRLDSPIISINNRENRLRGVVKENLEDKVLTYKKRIHDSAREAEATYQNWEEKKHELVSITPTGKLLSIFQSMVEEPRWERILKFYDSDNFGMVLEKLSNLKDVNDFLNLLDGYELLSIENKLQSKNQTNEVFPAFTKSTLIKSIMTKIGLLSLDQHIAGNNPPEQNNKAPKKDFDVFLAHNSQDKKTVLEIANALRKRGISPWIDIEQIPPGRWFQDVIQSAITKVNAAVIFLGSNGIGKWQALEIRSFISQCVESEIPLIPVLLPGTSKMPEDLLFLRELNFVRFTTTTDDSEAIDKLIWGITGVY